MQRRDTSSFGEVAPWGRGLRPRVPGVGSVGVGEAWTAPAWAGPGARQWVGWPRVVALAEDDGHGAGRVLVACDAGRPGERAQAAVAAAVHAHHGLDVNAIAWAGADAADDADVHAVLRAIHAALLARVPGAIRPGVEASGLDVDPDAPRVDGLFAVAAGGAVLGFVAGAGAGVPVELVGATRWATAELARAALAGRVVAGWWVGPSPEAYGGAARRGPAWSDQVAARTVAAASAAARDRGGAARSPARGADPARAWVQRPAAVAGAHGPDVALLARCELATDGQLYLGGGGILPADPGAALDVAVEVAPSAGGPFVRWRVGGDPVHLAAAPLRVTVGAPEAAGVPWAWALEVSRTVIGRERWRGRWARAVRWLGDGPPEVSEPMPVR